MTNNTINNVPRGLLDRAWRALANSATGREIGAYLDADHCAPECAETCTRASVCATCSADLSAPSPAGVDGLEVVAWLCEWMGDKCGGVYSGLSKTSLEGLRRSQGEDVLIVSDEPLCRLSDAQAIVDGLRGEVERLQMQLAACGVVALANTIESAGEARQMHPDYMSASCSDVAGAVDREIALRTESDQQAQRIGELETALEFACKSLAQVTSSDGSGHADIAVSVLRMAGTKDADALHVVEAYKAGAKWRIDAALSAGKDSEQ